VGVSEESQVTQAEILRSRPPHRLAQDDGGVSFCNIGAFAILSLRIDGGRVDVKHRVKAFGICMSCALAAAPHPALR